VKGIDQFVLRSPYLDRVAQIFSNNLRGKSMKILLACPYIRLKQTLLSWLKSTDWSGAQWNIYGLWFRASIPGGGGDGVIPSFPSRVCAAYNFDRTRKANCSLGYDKAVGSTS